MNAGTGGTLAAPTKLSKKPRGSGAEPDRFDATTPDVDRTNCPACGATGTAHVADVRGRVVRRVFHLRRCPACGLAFVANPCTDYARIYDKAYYLGRGADPLVDYVYEMRRPGHTVRMHEWAGVVERVRSLTPVNRETRWLDFGCGNGGLVRYVRDTVGCDVAGYDLGWITAKAARAGLPILNDQQLDAADGSFDVVTAIEVLEHVAEPPEVLRRIRRLLKPGGLFFYTTGNAAPHRNRLAAWGYVRPDIHLSYYEPQTLTRLLTEAGFVTEPGGYGPGATDIIRFKALKNLGVRRRSWVQSLLPWPLAARLLNRKLGIFDHPIARAPKQS